MAAPTFNPTSMPSEMPAISFQYLPWVALTVFLEFNICLYFLVRQLKKRYLKYANASNRGEGVSAFLLKPESGLNYNESYNEAHSGDISSVAISDIKPYLFYCSFERTFSGLGFKSTKGGMFTSDDEFSLFSSEVFLLVFRFICFGYFFIISSGWNMEREDWKNYYFFTTWNAILLSIYFFCAFTCSCIGIYYKYNGDAIRNTNIEWSSRLITFANFVHVLFEVAGASAFLVTVVAFTLLNHEFTFWNMSLHFFTSCSMLIEMFINGFYVDPLHIIFNLIWAAMFCAFIWPYVYFGMLDHWPYPFLDTGSPACFGWYSGLIIGNFIFWGLWWGLFQLKKRLRPNVKNDFILDNKQPYLSNNNSLLKL